MSKCIDLTGQTFGNLQVIQRDTTKKGVYWLCKCNCGNPNFVSIRSDHLRKGETISCGCVQREKARKNTKSRKDYTNTTSGWLTLLYPTNKCTKSHNIIWKAECKCGNVIEMSTSDIGKKLSCGCRPIIDFTNQHINNFTVQEYTFKRDKNGYYIWKCQCDCGNIFEVSSKNIRYRKSCGCIRSYKEKEIELFLTKHNINFQQQYSFSDLLSNKNYPLRFDFAIFDINTNLLGLIEYQGRQHYDKQSKYYSVGLIQRDYMKQQYCKTHNIPLLILDKTNAYDDILTWYQGLVAND